MKMRCLVCPMWYPLVEDSGYCLYSNCETHANYICKTLKDCKPVITKGLPSIPSGINSSTKNTMMKILVASTKGMKQW